MRYFIAFLFTLFSVGLPPQALAQADQSEFVLTSDCQSEENSIQHFIDDGRTIEINDLLGDNTLFSSDRPTHSNYGIITGNLWLKLDVNNQTSFNDWVMRLENEHLYQVSVYQYDQNKNPALKYLFRPDDKRYSIDASVELNPHSNTTLFIKIHHTSSPIIAPISVIETKAYEKEKLISQIMWFFFVSVLITLAFLNVVSFIGLRDWSILPAIAYMLLIVISQQAFMGYLYLWLPEIQINQYSQNRHFYYLGLSLCLLFFTYIFLDIPRLSSRAAKWFKAHLTATFSLILLGLLAIEQFRHVAFYIAMLGGITTIILMLVACHLSYKHQLYERHYFTIATVSCALGAIASMCSLSGLIESHIVIKEGFEIGSLVQTVMISIAFRQRYISNITKELKHAAKELEANYTYIEEQSVTLDIARRRAEQANTIKSQFLTTMSHEFRTPLNAILGFAAQIKTKIKDETINEQVSIINESANNLRIIVNDLLDYSQIESNDLQVLPSTFTPQELLSDLIAQANRDAEVKGLELVYFQSKLPESLTGDKDKIEQVAHHLIRNAIKYTDKGFVLIEVEYQREDNEQSSFNIRVEDSGTGISQRVQDNLFNNIASTDNTFARSHQGSGLGLFISQKLARLMGGEITVNSQLNVGSVFNFRIPISASKETEFSVQEQNKRSFALMNFTEIQRRAVTMSLEQIGAEVVRPYEPVSSGATVCWNESPKVALSIEKIKTISERFPKNSIVINCISKTYLQLIQDTSNLPVNVRLIRKPLTVHKLIAIDEHWQKNNAALETEQNLSSLNILAVDDMKMNLQLLATWLGPTKANLTEALSGQQAVELCKTNEYDLILMDIQMPGMDGITASQAIRKIPLNMGTPIVAVTAHAFEEEKRTFLNSGMDDHIAKPINLNGLMSVITTWCDIDKVNAKCDNLDWNAALERAQGNTALAESIFTQFKTELRNILPKIKEAEASNNHSDLLSYIHAIHGISCQTGVPKLRTLCSEIEGLLKQGYYENAYHLMTQFHQVSDVVLSLTANNSSVTESVSS